MRIWRAITLLALLGIILPKAFAQETYIAKNEAFYLTYPSTWQIIEDGEREVIFAAPHESEKIEITFTLHPNFASAEEAALSLIDSNAEIYDTLNFDIQGKPAFAIGVNAGSLDKNVVAMEVGLEQVVTASLTATAEQVEALGTEIVNVLATFRFSDDEVTYIRPDNSVGFRYPASWLVDEYPDYTLLILPTGVSFGVSAMPALEGADSVVFQAERVRDEALTSDNIGLTDNNEIETFEFEGLPAARLDLMQDDLLLVYFVLTLNDNTLANLTILGEPNLVEDSLEQALSLAETLFIPEGVLTEENPPAPALALEKTYLSVNSDLRFQYPLGWVIFQESNQIVVASNQRVLDGGSLDDLQSGEVVVLVFPSLSVLPEPILNGLGEEPVPLEVIAALSADVTSSQREKQNIGGRSGAVSISQDQDFDFFDVAVLMPDGDIVSLLGTARRGEGSQFRETILAIAASLEQN